MKSNSVKIQQRKNRRLYVRIRRMFLRYRVRAILLRTSVKLFVWAMRIEKKKYPLYWVGDNFKLHKFATWQIVYTRMIERELKIKIQAGCNVVLANGILTTSKMDHPGLTNRFYVRMCMAGAECFNKEAKLRNEKPEVKSDMEKHQDRIAGEKINKGDAVMVRKGKSGGKKLHKVEVRK